MPIVMYTVKINQKSISQELCLTHRTQSGTQILNLKFMIITWFVYNDIKQMYRNLQTYVATQKSTKDLTSIFENTKSWGHINIALFLLL